MKKIITSVLLIMALATWSNAQTLNWRSINEDQKNMAYLNFGYDYAVSTQVGYARSINTFKPVVLSLDYSFPMGENLFDDFKLRAGGQIELFEHNGFSVSTGLRGNFKSYETQMVKISSFGTEISALAGYYKPTWHIAGEVGFDKSITSHLKHSEIMNDNYTEIEDGWYVPSGGYFYYGIQGSKTLTRQLELSLKAGLTNAERKDENAMLPYYAQIGIIFKF